MIERPFRRVLQRDYGTNGNNGTNGKIFRIRLFRYFRLFRNLSAAFIYRQTQPNCVLLGWGARSYSCFISAILSPLIAWRCALISILYRFAALKPKTFALISGVIFL